MNIDSRIYVAGHNGLVGSAIVRSLQRYGYRSLILRPRRELDLLEHMLSSNFFLRSHLSLWFSPQQK